ncbi:MAG: hypothetical protein LBT53_03270 [Puniceicoccales bacterium]|jgi:hypothetical protein|nr:hypothetical protein [Puniceicoccales bacterium]
MITQGYTPPDRKGAGVPVFSEGGNRLGAGGVVARPDTPFGRPVASPYPERPAAAQQEPPPPDDDSEDDNDFYEDDAPAAAPPAPRRPPENTAPAVLVQQVESAPTAEVGLFVLLCLFGAGAVWFLWNETPRLPAAATLSAPAPKK